MKAYCFWILGVVTSTLAMDPICNNTSDCVAPCGVYGGQCIDTRTIRCRDLPTDLCQRNPGCNCVGRGQCVDRVQPISNLNAALAVAIVAELTMLFGINPCTVSIYILVWLTLYPILVGVQLADNHGTNDKNQTLLQAALWLWLAQTFSCVGSAVVLYLERTSYSPLNHLESPVDRHVRIHRYVAAFVISVSIVLLVVATARE